MKALRTYRKRQVVRVLETGVLGEVAAVNENCVVVWLDDGTTLILEPVDADRCLKLV